MELELFLQQKAFKKYAKTISNIKSEFISNGYEKFLWRHHRDIVDSESKTRGFISKAGEFIPNENIVSFMNQFDFVNWNKEIAFIYPQTNQMNYYLIQEVNKKAKKVIIINNIFSEDPTVNYISIYDRNDTENIVLMYHLTYGSVMGDCFGGLKFFGKGIMYYADNLEYDGTVLVPEFPHTLGHFQGNNTRRDTDPFKIFSSRKDVEMLIRLKYFDSELEIFRNFYNILLPTFQTWYENIKQITVENKEFPWKNKIDEVRSELVGNGTIKGKWKSEQELFKLVKSIHKTAIFQYRPKWLEPQSLDIFIPELLIGIEYQGLQHYQSVDFFGGEEGLDNRKRLDSIKKERCTENNIRLIEWKYDEEIDEFNLEEKLK